MSLLKAILFDNDGVLAHTERHWVDANQKVLSKMGIPYTKEDFITHTFKEGWGSRGWLERQGCNEETIKDFFTARNALWQQKITSLDVTDEHALPVLKELKPNYRLAVVTNTGRDDFKSLHWNASALLELFDIMILREDYDRSKPEPDAYEAALEKLNILPTETLVVEDSPRGILSAQRAGIQVVAIRNPDFPSLDLSSAEYEISSLIELPELIYDLR